jgi:nicotinate-nucleotide adenylyltransferase
VKPSEGDSGKNGKISGKLSEKRHMESHVPFAAANRLSAAGEDVIIDLYSARTGRIQEVGVLQAKKRIGIIGGTFDPIHYGHLVNAEGARVEFGLDKVIFVPSGKPPHKKDYHITDPEDRYLMTLLATITNPHFELSRAEIDRTGLSYTVDTIREFKTAYGGVADLFFITGADAILEILTWKNVGELITLCQFVAATRPGYSLTGLQNIVSTVRQKERADFTVHSIEVPALMISSTDIRHRVAGGRPIKYLLPEAVENYIFKEKLYVGGR